VEEILCKDLPVQFCKFLKYAKELEYDEKPDSRRMRHEFKVLFMESCCGTGEMTEHNFRFDWAIGAPEKPKKRGERKNNPRAMNIQITALSPSKEGVISGD
jgi:hypothetical protein